MKRLLLRLIVAVLTFLFSYAVTWVTAYFGGEPAPGQIAPPAILLMQRIELAQGPESIIEGRLRPSAEVF